MDNAMTDDERAIRALVGAWLTASKAGDLPTVLGLMTDDVVFMVPGQEPFGKEAFKATSEEMGNVQIEGTSDIQEIQVLGDWAYLRNYIEMTLTPLAAASLYAGPVTHSQYFVKNPMGDGGWHVMPIC